MLKVLFLELLAFVTISASVIFQDCGSAYELHAVYIEGCGLSLPCYVTLGEETPVKLQFYADFPSNLLDQEVVIDMNLVLVNADVTPDNCGVNDDCPVNTGAVNIFNSVMSVPKRMALNQRGFLYWRVYNERKNLLICYFVLVQTQSPAQKILRQTLSRITPEFANDIIDNLDLETAESSLSSYLESDPDENRNQNYLKQLIDLYFEQLSKVESSRTQESG